jgi:hypothetical protein
MADSQGLDRDVLFERMLSFVVAHVEKKQSELSIECDKKVKL